MLQIRDLSRDEKRRVSQAFSKASSFPGFTISAVGVLLNIFAGRSQQSVAVLVIVLVLCVSGLAIGLTMGFSARRRELEAIEEERRHAADA